ncbi:phage tail protein [Erwinia billingiae]|uniref:phage tail protein n=1 Tax=Erwinia billingiae TaxID=182337 RepID=UPI00069DDD93|nr:phage tail protein [Erwinia billingiae]
MTQKYYAIVTNLGAAKIANAAALGTKLNITQMAVGDGNGSLPTPTATQTALVHENRRAAVNALSVDPANPSQIVAEQIIPETDGGFWIREMGLFSEDGTLIAVCNTPETYKPALQEGSGRTQTVRMILIVNSTDAITLKIDPSVVLATRKYVDEAILTVRQYADTLMAEHIVDENPHQQYLQIANALSEVKSAGLVTALFANLGLGEGAKLPSGSALMGASGWLTIPVKISGELKNIILQWKTVSVSPSTDGNMKSVNSNWPIAFPTECSAIIQALTNSVIYAINGSPFTAAMIVDRASFTVGSAYTKSNSNVTVWGIGY